MKRAITIFKLFIVSLVLFSCNAEDPADLDSSLYEPDVDLPEDSAGTFTAKLNGEDYVVDITTAKLDPISSIIVITGKQGNEAITLYMPADITQNNVTNPYVLGPLSVDNQYSGFYNTDVTNGDTEIVTTSQATTAGDLSMIIDESTQKWITDVSDASITNGVTRIVADRGAKGESLEFILQTDVAGTYTFGLATGNLGKYTEPGFAPGIYETDSTIESGSIKLEIDETNKLLSGEFSFAGIDEGMSKEFTSGSFTNVPYDQPSVKRGLNISTHDTELNRIVGTYNFIAASIGEDPAQWNIITEGTFDVVYTVGDN
jgi:hypothetical protein